nr:unnamed protein product [Haemonchus contortus]
MIAQPQVYYDAEGKKHKLTTEQDSMEAIIDDQLKAINELYMTIRNMRATALNEERAMRDTTQETMAKTISAIQSSLEEMSSQLTRGQAHPRECEKQRRSQDVDMAHGSDMEVEEPELSEDEVKALEYTRRTLLAKIHVLEIRIHSLEQEKPCQIREFISGVDRKEETTMRCTFCGHRGKHYSDSVPEYGTVHGGEFSSRDNTDVRSASR